ncbi:hypothetical protein EUX98_g4784 [Antrodiella citrinella]|uniref:Uncharacterized protein n=1 Tax=Antrodiella citrinella TaxID=2447956 RepID=A0A4V3XIJ6_9APHY|nr:hypothetical protein EUX98_g4784 [Antrodiella citrinella]
MSVTTTASVHIDAFFASHPTFNYNPTRPFVREFNRMATQFYWGRYERRDQMSLLRGAVAEQFNAYYGEDENDARGWQELCVVLGIYPVPPTVAERRQAVKSQNVNIFDYIEAKRLGVVVKKFKSIKALAKYSYDEDKIFPKAQAKAGGLLKYLLREIAAARASH